MKHTKLTREQKEIAIGLMLGDGHLETQNEGRSYKLYVEQSKEKHGEYVQHLFEVFQNITKQKTPVEKPKDNNKNTLFFRTREHPGLRFIAKLFYTKGGKKVIPKNIKCLLTDRVLAYWYMDDGALKGKNRSGKRLHTECFTEEEVKRLRDALIEIGIKTTAQKQNRATKTYSILYITAEGDRVLTERIQQYVVPCMSYKLRSI